jgi:hypothetical protein
VVPYLPPSGLTAGPASSKGLVRGAGTPIKLYIAGLEIRILSEDGKLLRELTLDTTRIYQPRGKA